MRAIKSLSFQIAARKGWKQNVKRRSTKRTEKERIRRDELQRTTQKTFSDPEQELFLREALEAIRHLPEPQRGSISLFMEGFSYSEIAELLTIPLGTVSAAIHRARQTLLSLLS